MCKLTDSRRLLRVEARSDEVDSSAIVPSGSAARVANGE
jgi:hypothetical protein